MLLHAVRHFYFCCHRTLWFVSRVSLTQWLSQCVSLQARVHTSSITSSRQLMESWVSRVLTTDLATFLHSLLITLSAGGYCMLHCLNVQYYIITYIPKTWYITLIFNAFFLIYETYCNAHSTLTFLQILLTLPGSSPPVQLQGCARNDRVFDLVLIIKPCNERCLATW
jgi:hypothetical protein